MMRYVCLCIPTILLVAMAACSKRSATTQEPAVVQTSLGDKEKLTPTHLYVKTTRLNDSELMHKLCFKVNDNTYYYLVGYTQVSLLEDDNEALN